MKRFFILRKVLGVGIGCLGLAGLLMPGQTVLKVAELGFAPAQWFVGASYQRGEGGLPMDVKEAEKWLLKAAEKGHLGSQIDLSLIYFQGKGSVPKDYDKWLYWCTKAAEQGDAAVQDWLAGVYLNGVENIPKDLQKAYLWASLAVENGHTEAQEIVREVVPQLTPAQINAAKAEAARIAKRAGA